MLETALLAWAATVFALCISSQVLLLVILLRHKIYINAENNTRPGRVETGHSGSRFVSIWARRATRRSYQQNRLLKWPAKLTKCRARLSAAGRKALARQELI